MNSGEKEKKHGGARKGAGRKKVEAAHPSQPNKARARKILDSLGDPNYSCSCVKLINDSNAGTCEICLWREHCKNDRGALEYLWNRDEGRPVQNVNHLHDKPIEHNVTVTISEIVRKIRERKLAHERAGN